MLTAYKNKYSCHNVLIGLSEKRIRVLDNKLRVGMLMMDLSCVFDYMPRPLLMAKLNAYGVAAQSCKLMLNYLSNRTQSVKLNCYQSDCVTTSKGVPQGSVLGPLL